MSGDETSRPAAIVLPRARSAGGSRPVALTAVRLQDGFWRQRVAGVATSTIAKIDAMNEGSGRYENFRVVAGESDATVRGLYFNDSDVYKWIEAAAWSLAHFPNAALEERIDEVVALLGRAQLDDGYLNTFYQGADIGKRWTAFRHHEMYCAGHLMQAAIAYHRVCGKRELLEIACRFADHICERFADDRDPGVDTHPEIEMALVELFRETGRERYLRQARYFVDARGKHDIDIIEGPAFDQGYHQNRIPLREMQRMEGHAVRMLYLCSGAADVVAETGDSGLHDVLLRLWDNMSAAHLYVTGGLGARHETEGFGDDHVLPNRAAYAETCAAVASIMWNWRMLLLDTDRRYSDLIELTLYNAMLAGISLDGERFFYVNPLENDGGHRRQDWFECACCPSNIARLLASLPAYLYTVADGQVYVHLYDANDATLELGNGNVLQLHVETRYPWDEEIRITVTTAGPCTLNLRIPAWAGDGWRADINGDPVDDRRLQKGYLSLQRDWSGDDTVALRLPMPVCRLSAHPKVQENHGKLALMRGPLVYCIEGHDNPGLDIDALCICGDGDASIRAPDDGTELVFLEMQGRSVSMSEHWDGRLYRDLKSTEAPVAGELQAVVALPYFAWANRSDSAMRVWIPAC